MPPGSLQRSPKRVKIFLQIYYKQQVYPQLMSFLLHKVMWQLLRKFCKKYWFNKLFLWVNHFEKRISFRKDGLSRRHWWSSLCSTCLDSTPTSAVDVVEDAYMCTLGHAYKQMAENAKTSSLFNLCHQKINLRACLVISLNDSLRFYLLQILFYGMVSV